MEMIGAFESTYLPRHDVDVMESSGHVARWREDLADMAGFGVRRLRYPIRWHRVEPEPGRFDWSATDEVMDGMVELGLVPVVDLVHHTSYPTWLHGFGDPRFGPAYLRYCEAVAQRYPGIAEYTVFNEPFATLFLAGHEGVWPPYGRGMAAFAALLANVLPALAEASTMLRDLLPAARHVWVDTCEGHAACAPGGEDYAAMANDRRFAVLDLVLGRDVDPDRPFLRRLLEAGGEDLFTLAPGHVDVLGLDYYAHSEWAFRPARDGLRSTDGLPVEGVCPSPVPVGLAALARQYADRYGLPMMLSETNIRGTPADRATWLRHTLEQCELARAGGVPLEGFCWFPFVDSLDWNSLLANCDRCIDPVGVLWLDEELERHGSSMSLSYARAAAGAPSAALPAYRFSEPVRRHVAALLPLMSHWNWRDAPQEESSMDCERIVRARTPEVAR